MSKLEEAKEILSSLKVPAKQQNGMCCCVLFAMANLTEEETWGSAANIGFGFTMSLRLQTAITEQPMVNLGCLLASEATPTASGMKIIKASDIRRMSEYGANYPIYREIQGKVIESETDVLKEQLKKSIDLLELTGWQKQKMHEISINTIGDLISAPEGKLKQAKYIADVRARTIKNAGIAAVCEYLLG